MINLFNAQIESLSLHKVGNKSRNEEMVLSKEPYRLTDEITPLIKEFFFKPFREKEKNYFQFAHDVDLEYNEMYMLASRLFANPDHAHEISSAITRHLYNQSNHPHIKNGEVYITYIKNLSIDNNVVDAIGIFKSEIKNDFLQIDEKESNLEMQLLQGISLDKLDKGCLIFNYKKEEGYKILSVDSNRYDTRYWLEHFLSVDTFHDENFLTKKYMKFVQDFGIEVVFPAEDKKEQVMFQNRAIDYFGKNDDFEESTFLNEVIDNPDLISEFKNFKVDKGAKYSIEDVTTFPISNSAVTDARKKFKNHIKLDTEIEVKLNFINPEKADQLIEKGWDEEKQMYYYLLYFNKEVK